MEAKTCIAEAMRNVFRRSRGIISSRFSNNLEQNSFDTLVTIAATYREYVSILASLARASSLKRVCFAEGARNSNRSASSEGAGIFLQTQNMSIYSSLGPLWHPPDFCLRICAFY